MPAEIRNCEFLYKCPKSWDALIDTLDKDRRFCMECGRTVHYCHTPYDLHSAIVSNKCVAIETDIPDDSRECNVRLGIPSSFDF